MIHFVTRYILTILISLSIHAALIATAQAGSDINMSGRAVNQYNSGVRAIQAGDYDKSFLVFKQLAEKGHKHAQNQLALHYSQGQGTKKDNALAVKWYSASANQGHAGAQYWLAKAYLEGEGVTQDFNEAEKWFLESATQKDLDAQGALASMYYYEQYGRKDLAKAFTWISALEINGEDVSTGKDMIEKSVTVVDRVLSHCLLYHMYEDGMGVDKSSSKANSHQEKAKAIDCIEVPGFQSAIKVKEHGSIYMRDGLYEGDMIRQRPHQYYAHGKGTITGDNVKYKGEMQNGRKHGYGIYTTLKDEKEYSRYEGNFKKDKRYGQGTYTSPTTNDYKGDWKNDMPYGHGVMTTSNGKFTAEFYDWDNSDWGYYEFDGGTVERMKMVDGDFIRP